jgi:hypothetical protein
LDNLKDGFFFTYDNEDGTVFVEYPNGKMILASGLSPNNEFIKIIDLSKEEALKVLNNSWDKKYFDKI